VGVPGHHPRRAQAEDAVSKPTNLAKPLLCLRSCLRSSNELRLGSRGVPRPGNMALKVVKTGTLHAQMGRSMAHIYCSPTLPRVCVCVEGGVSRWLVGVVDLRAELLQRSQAARGALVSFECLRKTRGVQALGHGARRPGRDG
jgi:hypothetical protein